VTTTSPRTLRRTALAVTGLAATLAATSIAPALASSAKHAKPARPAKDLPVVAGSRYLALGDSVSFGYREANAIPAPNDKKAKTIIGYPEDVAANLGLKLTNAACPGETTGSFLNTNAQSNRCENSYSPTAPHKVPGGYRTAFPLHTKYASANQSQLAFAEAYLKKYPDTRLVTLMIGANDGFLCLAQTSDGCVSEFGALQASITKNAKKIFKGLRKTAGYRGQIAVLTYYSTDYRSQIGDIEAQGVSTAVLNAAKGYDVEVADGFGQFQHAAQQAKGDTCAAQLLTALSGANAGTCGVHPSIAGQALLAQAVERAIKK
jgi:lysophospholipase L1-like esterase